MINKNRKESKRLTQTTVTYLTLVNTLLASTVLSTSQSYADNYRDSGFELKNYMYKQATYEKLPDKTKIEEYISKINAEKALGVFDKMGTSGLGGKGVGLQPGMEPQTEEEMNKLGILPGKYVGDVKDQSLQHPKPDTLAEMLAGFVKFSADPFKRPTGNDRMSSSFGWRNHPIFGAKKPHQGIDISGSSGHMQYAVWPGTVIYSAVMAGYGNLITIKHGDYFETRYAHLVAPSHLKVGDKVKPGDPVGKIGSTGNSTGPHIHFEVRFKEMARDPYYWLIQQTGGDKPISELPGLAPTTEGLPPGEWEWPPQTPQVYTIEDFRAGRMNGLGTSDGDDGITDGAATKGSMKLPTTQWKDASGKWLGPGKPKMNFFSYMEYNSSMVSRNSSQYKLMTKEGAYTDNHNMRRAANGDYFVALGSAYGNVGDRVQITIKGEGNPRGITFKATIGDRKDDSHTNAENQFHMTDGSILEFITDKRGPDKKGINVTEPGFTGPNFKGELKAIKPLKGDNGKQYYVGDGTSKHPYGAK